ncbi:MAG: metal ABC transporter substrate-binding protein [Thermomicrobiales bacterium]
MRAMRVWSLVVVVGLPLLLAACGGRSGSGKPVAITSFYPLYYFTSQIAGDRMEVRNLVPAGAEPHDWEPKARDIADISKAAVLVYNGAGLEHWIDATLDTAKSDKRVDIKATEGLTLLPPAPGEDADVTNDPHVWLDPTLAREIARKIADGLIKADPPGQATYEQNLAALVGKLDGLDTQFKDGLRTCARREIITAHAAFGYLARRYGLEQIAIEGLSPDSEPTPARIAEVTKIARDRKATHIFFETLVSPKVAEAIANEVGAKTLVLDPLEGVKDEKTQNYFTVMGDNLANLRTALGCK